MTVSCISAYTARLASAFALPLSSSATIASRISSAFSMALPSSRETRDSRYAFFIALAFLVCEVFLPLFIYILPHFVEDVKCFFVPREVSLCCVSATVLPFVYSAQVITFRPLEHPYYSTGFASCQEEIFSETKWSCLLIRFFGLQWGTLSCSLTLPLTVIIILKIYEMSSI